jgi:sulfatase maturation enzyme AslB (radical SAM superfamily)
VNNTTAESSRAEVKPPVDFLWLELTNRCNLQCIHCYAESGPFAAAPSGLPGTKYIEVMREAFALGCRRVQFIGGEPTLNSDLRLLIREASSIGFEFIEVFTNLTRMPPDLLQCFIDYGVRIATSVYADSAPGHDAITQVDGSFEKTTRNLRKLIEAGVPTRAAVIEMAANEGHTEATLRFLKELGVQSVGSDRLRHIGRGAGPDNPEEIKELCGTCAGGTMCVGPDGVVSPCIMSKKWAVGSVNGASLSEIATGARLQTTRQLIGEATEAARKATSGNCGPDSLCQPCQPHGSGCTPCYPVSSCAPTTCQPYKGW